MTTEEKEQSGLQDVFKSVFPIRDFSERAELQFVHFDLENPKYDEEECVSRGMTYSAPLRITLRLVVWDIDEDTGIVTTNADFSADFETAETQSFTVIATDGAGNPSEQVVTLDINDLDEIAPTITSSEAALAIEMGSAPQSINQCIYFGH